MESRISNLRKRHLYTRNENDLSNYERKKIQAFENRLQQTIFKESNIPVRVDELDENEKPPSPYNGDAINLLDYGLQMIGEESSRVNDPIPDSTFTTGNDQPTFYNSFERIDEEIPIENDIGRQEMNYALFPTKLKEVDHYDYENNNCFSKENANFYDEPQFLVNNSKDVYCENSSCENCSTKNDFPFQTAADEDGQAIYDEFEPNADEDESLKFFRRIKSFSDLLKNKKCEDKITATPNISIIELFTMMLMFYNKCGLSHSGLSLLAKFVNSIFNRPIIPQSRQKLDEIFNSYDDVNFHAVCPYCPNYVGELNKLEGDVLCNVCKKSTDWSKPSIDNLFSIINPSTTISSLLKQHETYYDYVVSERKHEDGVIKDIYDGEMYLKFVDSLSTEDRRSYATAVLNTDGASPYKFSKNSVWPIYLMLNEIPPQDRMNNIITVGLWYGKTKPNLNMFLSPMVDMLNDLSKEGIPIEIKGTVRKIKLFTLVCCVDAMARNPIAGIKSCSGFFSCCWCLHPGEYNYFSKSVKFPILRYTPKLREKESTIKIMRLSIDPGYIALFGIKHPSALINLSNFHIIWGLIVEYLHAVLIGAAKRVVPFLLRIQQMNNLEEFIKNIKLPTQVRRLARPLTDKKYWSAKDWENFILYYSLPLFSLSLDQKYLDYWCLLVEAMHILLGTRIRHSDIIRADKLLHRFVFETEEYFTTSAMYYNIHQLLHLSKSVLDWGPLWAISAFSFESANHYMMQAIKNARGAILQIQRYINFSFCSAILEHKISSNAPEVVKRYCSEAIKARLKNVKSISKGITYFGKGKIIDNQTATLLRLSANSICYSKLVNNNCLYTSAEKVYTRSNNSVAQLRNGKFIVINCFVIDAENKEYVLYYNLKTKKHSITSAFENLQIVEDKESLLMKTPTTNLFSICANFKINNTEFICTLPNLLSY